MDIGKIQGTKPQGQDPARSVSKDRASNQPERTSLGHGDTASISESGIETRAAVEALSQRARGDDGDRQQIVSDAAARLAAGDLDRPEVYEAVARRLLGED